MALRSISDSDDAQSTASRSDLRNFEVRTRSTKDRLGTVDDVLVDQSGQIRYLCVRHAGDDRHTLLPIGEVQADRTNRMVWAPVLHRESFGELPTWSHDPASIDTDYERRLAAAYDGTYTKETYYERPEYRTRGWGRGIVRESSGELDRLDRLKDYRIAEGEPDPRGWSVRGRDGRALGEVDHLIGDTASMRVRYLVVKVDHEIAPERREVLIPVGHVDLDINGKRVLARGFDANCIADLPGWSGRRLTREEEERIIAACGQPYEEELRYSHPRYREEPLRGEEQLPRTEEALARERRPDLNGERRPGR